MKKFLLVLLVLITSVFGFVGCGKQNSDQSVVRIHIRANSNSKEDQGVKLQVRDDVIDYITPLIADCENSEDVKITLEENLSNIENIADQVLNNYGFNYVSTARICNEYFPSRKYNSEIFPADYYDALILNLGTGEGDNWWCVAYPPLCFVGDDNGGSNVVYKSKMLELINKYFGGK